MQKPNRIGWAGCTNRNRVLAPRPGLEPGTYGLTVFRPGTETHSSEFWELRNPINFHPINFLDSDVVVCVAVFHRAPGFCVIFHARLHRNYTGIFTAPCNGKGFQARRGGDSPTGPCLPASKVGAGDTAIIAALRLPERAITPVGGEAEAIRSNLGMLGQQIGQPLCPMGIG